MTTQEIIECLRYPKPLHPPLLDVMGAAADRLEELQRLNDSMQVDRNLWIKVGREKLEAAESEIATQKNLYALSLKRIDGLLKELHEMRVETAQCKEAHNEAQAKAEKAHKLRKEAEIERDSLRDTMALDMLQLTQERDEARAELKKHKQVHADCQDYTLAIQQLDEARAEVERLKTELDEEMTESAQRTHDLAKLRNEWRARCESAEATVKQLLTVRPEPSRLEIAAMFAVAAMIAKGRLTDHADSALLEADALIAAAKEGK